MQEVAALVQRLDAHALVQAVDAAKVGIEVVAALIAEGLTNGQLAERLFISPKTAAVHVSNILTKVLEWGRLMSYLEQSTRYIAYDARLGGRYRFHRDPDVLASQFGTRYVGDTFLVDGVEVTITVDNSQALECI